MSFRLFVDSSNGVTVDPEYGMKDSATKVETRHRTRSGKEYVYKWGQFSTVEAPVLFVNSEFRSIVNSWWSSNTDLLWMEEGGSDVTPVRITNKKQPIDQFIKPYNNLFKGKISLGTY